MTTRLRLWYCKHLSYVARLKLITSVLMEITAYWCQLFILPWVIIRKANTICRAYLWHGDINDSSKGNIAWNKICQSKKSGGLGIRNLDAWNTVTMGKLSWHVSSMHESLWVR